MSKSDHSSALERLAALLAADNPDVPEELRSAWEQAQWCIRLLEQLPPAGAAGGGAAETPRNGDNADDGRLPESIGRFRIARELGSGGFGVVYLAWDPLAQRAAAVKVPRPDVLLAPELRRRFVTEARAAAALDHLNIVPLYEAGEDGPAGYYLASAYCPGLTLAAWLRARTDPVPVRDAAALAAALADGLAHAHARGVIHRDLKPANILLSTKGTKQHEEKTLVDSSSCPFVSFVEDFVPRITDFGLARTLLEATGEGDTDTGVILGTPEYMAPEQAAGLGKGAGPAADVYALGAILYELLTGRPPFRGDNRLETLLMVRADEPVPPRRLRANVPADLETVCLKCLEKDPARRYTTAGELADDLRRFLAGEPVRARPVGPLARGWRWCRRNRAVAALLAAVVVVLATGAAVASVLAVIATEQADQALKRLGQIDKGNAILTSAFVDLDPRAEEKEGKPLRAILGERFTKAAEQLEGEAVGDPHVVAGLQYRLGAALVGLGFSTDAILLLQKARDTWAAIEGSDHRLTLNSMHGLARCYLDAGQVDQALRLFEETLILRKAKLGPDDPDTLENMSSLAVCCTQAGQVDRAVLLLEGALMSSRAKLGSDHPDTISRINNLAEAYTAVGRQSLALTLHEEAVNLAKVKLGPDHPTTLTATHNLAKSCLAADQLSRALLLWEENLKRCKATLGPDHPNTLNNMGSLASGYRAAGRLKQALPLYEESLRLWRLKFGPNHPLVGTSMNNLAQGYRDAGQLDRALPLMEESVRLGKLNLGPDNPDTLTRISSLALGYQDAGQIERALPLLQEAARGVEARGFKHQYAGVIISALSRCHDQLQQHDQAETWWRKLVALMKQREDTEPVPYAAVLAGLGHSLLLQEKWADAEVTLREALAIREKHQPNSPNIFTALSWLGGALSGQQKYADAEPLLVRGYEGMKQSWVNGVSPASLGKRLRTEALERLVQLYCAWGKPEEAVKWFKELEALKAGQTPPRKP